MENKKNHIISELLKQSTVLALIIIWTIPTLGLFVSSLRDKDDLSQTGWWQALFPTERVFKVRTAKDSMQIQEDGKYILRGNLFPEEETGKVLNFGFSVVKPSDHNAGDAVSLKDDSIFRVDTDGNYEWVSEKQIQSKRGKRVYLTAEIAPRFSLDNYREVIAQNGIGQSFLNSFTVTLPATFIPILIAAFAAYALAWMKFRSRFFILSVIIGLLVVPLQMSLVPILGIFNQIGALFGAPAKGYWSIWMAHTGFGLPLAIYLLYNYIASIPGDIMEAASIDGADHFKIFVSIILPLSLPALASFAIFQFLWVWNDLLVALVFLGKDDTQIVLTSKLRELLGSHGGNWEILTASAFITIAVPLTVFLSLQRYFVRGLLAGSIK